MNFLDETQTSQGKPPATMTSRQTDMTQTHKHDIEYHWPATQEQSYCDISRTCTISQTDMIFQTYKWQTPIAAQIDKLALMGNHSTRTVALDDKMASTGKRTFALDKTALMGKHSFVLDRTTLMGKRTFVLDKTALMGKHTSAWDKTALMGKYTFVLDRTTLMGKHTFVLDKTALMGKHLTCMTV